MTSPIYVPTKGRADCARTPALLSAAGLAYTLVVEPQDEAAYRAAYPDAGYLVLGGDDRGLVYSRQSILDRARAEGQGWYWQIDDNLHGFYEVKARRCLPVSATDALAYAEAVAAEHKRVGLVALQYKQFAWSARKAYQFNRQAYCCVLTNTQTGIDYREGTAPKEDVDFLLQHLHGGWRSVTVNRYSMDKPAMGKNAKGGLVPLYRAGKHEDAARHLVSLWPRYCSLVSKPGGLDAKIDWQMFG